MAQNRIPWYTNGNCPVDRLIVMREGYNSTDGHWQHRLPRATLRRWLRLIDRAYRRTGRTLAIAEGWATDRPYDIQVIAQRIYGNLAATPGKSSHGMIFEYQQTAAIDAGNWAWVYEKHGYDAWLSDLRAEGFDRLPNGYPLEGERHHIIDYNPWDDEPEFGGAPASTDSKDFDMPLSGQDLINLLNASFDTGRVKPDGTPENVSIAKALGAVYFYGDKLNGDLAALPDAVWSHPLEHTVAKGVDGSPVRVAAGDILRYEPAEHDGTRRAVALVSAGDIDYERVVEELKKAGLDPQAFAVYAADEADRRERERLNEGI